MKLPAIRQLPSGSWFCRLRIGGKDICITEPTQEKCQARAMAYKTGVLKAKKEPASVTLRAACNAYIDARRDIREATTILAYEKYRDQYLQGLMEKRLEAITERMISQAVQQERQRKSRTGGQLSAKTIKSVVGFYRSVFKENGIILGQIIMPEVKRKVARIPAPPDVIRAIVGSDIELPCLLAAWLSLTMSEIRGLTKSKSILDGKLYVVETLVYIKGKDIRKEGGKEEQRTRALDIPPYIMELINRVDGDIIVPLTPRQIQGRFAKLIQAAGLPHMTFHQLRHLNASTMAMLGVQKEIARERGGWKTDYVMNTVYTHTFAPARQAADAAIDAYFTAQLKAQNGNKKATDSKKHRIFRLVKT